jgi:hypothetical protein
MITLEDIERVEKSSEWDGMTLALCEAARRGVDADHELQNAFEDAVTRAERAEAELAAIKAAQPEPMSDELIRKIMSDCGIHPSEAFGEVWTGNVQLLQFARALLAVPLPSAYTMTAPRCCGRTMKFTGIWREA